MDMGSYGAVWRLLTLVFTSRLEDSVQASGAPRNMLSVARSCPRRRASTVQVLRHVDGEGERKL